MATCVQSILDTDLYKLTMMMSIARHFPYARARYQFINRGRTKFPHDFCSTLQNELEGMRDLSLQDDESQYLRNIRFFKPPFVDFMRGFRFDPDDVAINQNGGDLDISIEGAWYQKCWDEVPVMETISELFFRGKETDPNWENKLILKIKTFRELGAKVADFGSRRRFAHWVHRRVCELGKEYGQEAFVGTSNVYLAKMLGLNATGTQAHEWIQAHAAIYGFPMANYRAMETWVKEFDGDLGIVLTDTFTTKNFFESFGLQFAKLYDGVRHDSGVPITFATKVIEHYESLGIDPTTKTIVFSDNLNARLVEEIQKFCQGKIRTAYGIGTNLTNDVGHQSLNMVIKLVALSPDGDPDNWIPTVKLSDVPGKHTGDPETIALCKRILGIG